MTRYFIYGQLAALDYIKATTKPQRMDLKNRYTRTMVYIEMEKQSLTQMLEDGEMRYRIWNGGRR